MYLLDTNHCIYLLEGNTAVRQQLQTLGKVQVGTSVIVCGELIFMAANSREKTSNLIRIKLLLQGLEIYPVDRETALVYGQLRAQIIAGYGPKEKAKRSKTRIEDVGISDNDLWIAATALRHALTVVSSDSDFERIQKVRAFQLENWLPA